MSSIFNFKKTGFIAFLFILLITSCSKIYKKPISPGSYTSSKDITLSEIKNHVFQLSQDSFQGRAPGTPGSKKALNYIEHNFKTIGLKPLPNHTSYQHKFNIFGSVKLGKKNFFSINGKSLKLKRDYVPMGFSKQSTLTAEAIFVGYGLVINDENLNWNDYQQLNVKDKWVVILRGQPQFKNLNENKTLKRKVRTLANDYNKMLIARDNGAAGIIFMPRDHKKGLIEFKQLKQSPSLGANQRLQSLPLPVLALSPKGADILLAANKLSLKNLDKLITNSQKPYPITFSNTLIQATVDLQTKQITAKNIIGYIEGSDKHLSQEYLLLTAHYDHVGIQKKPFPQNILNKANIFNGADDNASGITALLELAQKLAANQTKLKRSIVFAALDAEEKGLLGAFSFVQNPVLNLKQVVSLINYDMIGSLKNKNLYVFGLHSSQFFEKMIPKLAKKYGLNVNNNQTFKDYEAKNIFKRSDHYVFYEQDIPTLFFFTGLHKHYHQETDTWEKLNFEGHKQILDLNYELLSFIANTHSAPVFKRPMITASRVEKNNRSNPEMGILGNPLSQKAGVEILNITNSYGLASQLNLQKGDLIKAINGKTILNNGDLYFRILTLEKKAEHSITIQRGSKILNKTF